MVGTTDNGLITLNGSVPNATVESNLTFDGLTLQSPQISGSGYITAKTFQEQYYDAGSGASVALDLENANNFEYEVTNNATFTFDNPPGAPKAFGFTLVLENGGAYTITWPTGVLWANGNAPTLTTSGKDILVFYTYDTGTTYYGFLSAANMS